MGKFSSFVYEFISNHGKEDHVERTNLIGNTRGTNLTPTNRKRAARMATPENIGFIRLSDQ